MNKEFERCCRQIAKMMEKCSSIVLRDIQREIQYSPERWAENADYNGFMKPDTARKEFLTFEQGVKYFENGKKYIAGSFGNDRLIEAGTDYYENGDIKFISDYNKDPRTYYDPRYFVFGKLVHEYGNIKTLQ